MTADEVQQHLHVLGVPIPASTLRAWAAQRLLGPVVTRSCSPRRGRTGEWPPASPIDAATIRQLTGWGVHRSQIRLAQMGQGEVAPLYAQLRERYHTALRLAHASGMLTAPLTP